MMKNLALIFFCLTVLVALTSAQTPSQTPKKTNSRPKTNSPKEPFDFATVEKMREQCVQLDTEAGVIKAELFPENAPETVRNFLNLISLKAFDTTLFSRVVPNFVVQGGNVFTRLQKTNEMLERSRRTIKDEPSFIKHERGILSMARPDTPNGATSHFFILVRDSPHLDGTFTAFGRVTSGMDVVDAINNMPVEGEKPVKPVRLLKASIMACPKTTEP